MRARPNCTALTIFTSSCLEVWTGPLPGRKQDYSTNVSAEKRLWRNYFKTQRCLTIQFFLNENKNIKSLTNPVDSRRGAWIGPAASTGEVRVWKLLKRYFQFLNTILNFELWVSEWMISPFEFSYCYLGGLFLRRLGNSWGEEQRLIMQ